MKRWTLVALALMFASRAAFISTPYFADGPAHIKAIQSGIFVIQPPGYWLFNRLASFSPDPIKAIEGMNLLFSLAGAFVFYVTARKMLSEKMAVWSTIAYCSIFYCWFASDVHSTYASQFLFPVLVFYLLLLHEEKNEAKFLTAAALAFAIGAGLRPSDGAFIGPMFVYYLLSKRNRQAAVAFAVAVAGCIAWLIPTALAYHKAGLLASSSHYVPHVLAMASPLSHPVRGAANIARFAVPFLAAFWPLLKFLRYSRDQVNRLLWLWIVPGTAFFVFLYISDATYLVFMTAPVILLAALMLKDRVRPIIVCAAFNCAVFLFFRPVALNALPVEMIDCYVGQYTRFALAHHWEKNLSDLHRETVSTRK